MRNEFTEAINLIGKNDKKVIFLTGDLGFNAFEPLKKSFKSRFINAGVAEQNMIGVAAGLAKKGYKVFCYSIAPFIVYRCLEQIRNDVCFHRLPVYIVGNGGGFGYGIMGSSHHAISDLACISSLGSIKSWIPCFKNDVRNIVTNIYEENRPAYLRLGRSNTEFISKNKSGSFSIVKQALSDITIIALGSIVEEVLIASDQLKVSKAINILSCINSPVIFEGQSLEIIKKSRRIIVVEDHVKIGGISQQISYLITTKKLNIKEFISLNAKLYPSETYGDQLFHHKESGIDIEGIKAAIEQMFSI